MFMEAKEDPEGQPSCKGFGLHEGFVSFNLC